MRGRRRSTFSPSERSPIRVSRKDPEDRVAARTDSVGCQEMEVSDIVPVGRDWIGCGFVCSIFIGRSKRRGYVHELGRRCEEGGFRELLLMR